MICVLLSHTYHVIHHVTSCDVMLWLPVIWPWLCDPCDMTLSHPPFYVVSPKRKSKVNINNNLAILPSYDTKLTKVYSLSLVEKNSLDIWIDEELKKGYICLSTSLIAALFFFVKKHNRSLQSVMDYRALNAITVKNCYLIPRIADLIESLNKASIFTKIDLR